METLRAELLTEIKTHPTNVVIEGVDKYIHEIGKYITDHLAFLEESGLCISELITLANVELEVEQEQRLMVRVDETHRLSEATSLIEDLYDPSGTVRIRVKNGIPRIGIKIPMREMNTFRAKCCLRIEIKPNNEQQIEQMRQVYNLLKSQERTQSRNKEARKINLNDGTECWLNKNGSGEYWIELDEPQIEVENLLPFWLIYLSHKKSFVHLPEEDLFFRKFSVDFYKNTTVTSRSAKGEYDKSVSTKKPEIEINADQLRDKVAINSENICKMILDLSDARIINVDELKSILFQLALNVGEGISELKIRNWEVPYGRKTKPENLNAELEVFFINFFNKLREAEKGNLNPYELAAWVEWEIDAGLHPYVDGCGRIAKTWSAYLLYRLGKELVSHETRESYYEAMNGGLEAFSSYFLSRLENSNTHN